MNTEEINRALSQPNKDVDRQFLKMLATDLDDDDVLDGMHRLIIDSDPLGIETVVIVLLCVYHLRAEFIVWETEHRRPGLSDKQYARIELKECAAQLTDLDAVMRVIDHHVRNGIEEEAIDWACGLIDAVHELRDEFIAWAELPAVEAAGAR